MVRKMESRLLLIWNYGNHSLITCIQTVPVSDCKLKGVSAKQILYLASYKERNSYWVKNLWLHVGLSSGAASLHPLTLMNFLVGLPSYLPAWQSFCEFINPCFVINEVIRVVGLVQDINRLHVLTMTCILPVTNQPILKAESQTTALCILSNSPIMLGAKPKVNDMLYRLQLGICKDDCKDCLYLF